LHLYRATCGCRLVRQLLLPSSSSAAAAFAVGPHYMQVPLGASTLPDSLLPLFI